LELDGPISPVAEAVQDPPQVRKEEHCCTSLSGKFLFETKVARLLAEFAFFQTLQFPPLTVEHVGTGSEPLEGTHDQVQCVQRCTFWIEKIGGDAAADPVEYRRKLRKTDRCTGKPPCGTAPKDHFLNWVARNLLSFVWFEQHTRPTDRW